jgi:hypothetical protein
MNAPIPNTRRRARRLPRFSEAEIARASAGRSKSEGTSASASNQMERLWCKDQKPGIFGARVTLGEAD